MAFFLRGECLSALSFFYPPPQSNRFHPAVSHAVPVLTSGDAMVAEDPVCPGWGWCGQQGIRRSKGLWRNQILCSPGERERLPCQKMISRELAFKMGLI